MAGMVTAPHRLASQAGHDILAQGGTAIEAAVAMGAVLSVVYPHFCGIGGDAVWMVGDGSGTARCFLGIGQAIAASEGMEEIATRGPQSVTTSAAAVDSWGHALDYSTRHWGGHQSLGTLLSPAIALASDGFSVSPSQAHWHDFRQNETAQWPGFATAFSENRAGALLRQPDLARTLETIVAQGTRSFYEGDLAQKIVAGLASAGCTLTASDLEATTTREVAPLTLERKGVTLLAPPLPTQGVTTLQIMGILERLDPAREREGSAADYHLCVEAVKQAFLTRQDIADPSTSPFSVADALSVDVLDAQAAAIDRTRALDWPYRYRAADTVFFAAVDGEGNCASVLQSIYFDWGSGVVAGDTGVLWHNRGAAFSTQPGHPNAIAPGKLPFFTLNPGLALKDGKPYLLYGTQGADGQPQTLALVLSRILDHGLSPSEALARPRFLLGRTFSDANDTLKIESDIGENELSALASLGHAVSPIAPLNPLSGQAGVIRITDGAIDGAHDPRSEGVALHCDSGSNDAVL